MARPAQPVLYELGERLGDVEALDRLAGPLAAIPGAMPTGPVKDGLSGTWLGHALHPLLTDVPIGTWLSAAILDLFGGEESEAAADKLVAVGILAALPTALTGATEWADSQRSMRAFAVSGSSMRLRTSARWRSSPARSSRVVGAGAGRGRRLGLAGIGALMAGGHLGGHLSYAKGVGVDQTTFERRPDDWRPALADAALGEGQRRAVDVEGVQVLLVRDGGRVHALANRCCHRGGPLDRGEVADGCVTCPWHGSTFRLEDGSVVRGPAAYPQPAYDVRVLDGGIQVRAR